MNKYKIIENNGGLLIDAVPDYQKFMESGIEIESYSKHEAVCSIYDNLPNTWRQCYVLDTNTLKLFLVYWYRDSVGRITTTETFQSILEKPKLMKTYKIIPNQNKHPDSITYEFMNSYFTVESDSPVNAFRKYCERDSFVLNLDSNFGYVFDTKSLDLYYASWSINEQIGHSSFVKKLEKPIEKPKMNKYKILLDLDDPNPSFEKMMASRYSIEAASPKNAFIGHRTLNPRWRYAFILDTETLNLYRVSFSDNPRREYNECFMKKLEKLESKFKMKKYKLIPNQNNLNPSYKEMMISDLLIEADSPKKALLTYRVLDSKGTCGTALNSKVNCGMVLDTESLDLYRVLFDSQDSEYYDCFVKKLEKPKLMNTLSFKTLTEANNKRLPLFKNSKGLPAHSKPDGSDWSHAEWLQAVIGELGEYANIMKKVQRGDLTMEEAKPSIEKELADVMTYFAILAQQLNIDLGQAVENKFNEVSRRVECDIFIENDKVVTKSQDSLTWKGDEKFKAVFVNHDKDGKCAEKVYNQYWADAKLVDSEIENDSIVSKKDKLHNELDKLKVKVKKENLTAQAYHKPVSFSSEQIKADPVKWFNNQDFATNLMVGVGLAQILTQFFKKPAQKIITLQDLNNGKVYTRPFISGQDSTTLQEFSKLIVKDAIVMKTLLNGKDYDEFNVNVGDMIQFSDDRNVLYSLRVTTIS